MRVGICRATARAMISSTEMSPTNFLSASHSHDACTGGGLRRSWAGLPCSRPVKRGLHQCVARLFVGRRPDESVSASGLLFEVQWQRDKLEASLPCRPKAVGQHVRKAASGQLSLKEATELWHAERRSAALMGAWSSIDSLCTLHIVAMREEEF